MVADAGLLGGSFAGHPHSLTRGQVHPVPFEGIPVTRENLGVSTIRPLQLKRPGVASKNCGNRNPRICAARLADSTMKCAKRSCLRLQGELRCQ